MKKHFENDLTPRGRRCKYHKNPSRKRKGNRESMRKIVEDNFPSLKKEMVIEMHKANITQSYLNKRRTIGGGIIVKLPIVQDKENTMKLESNKKEIAYKGKSIRLTSDFLEQTLQTRTE